MIAGSLAVATLLATLLFSIKRQGADGRVGEPSNKSTRINQPESSMRRVRQARLSVAAQSAHEEFGEIFANATLSAAQQQAAAEDMLSRDKLSVQPVWLPNAHEAMDSLMQNLSKETNGDAREVRRECFAGGCLLKFELDRSHRVKNLVLQSEPSWTGERAIFPPQPTEQNRQRVMQTVILFAPASVPAVEEDE